MNRLIRIFLLLFLVFVLIGAFRFLAISRLAIMAFLLLALVMTIFWILNKASKK